MLHGISYFGTVSFIHRCKQIWSVFMRSHHNSTSVWCLETCPPLRQFTRSSPQLTVYTFLVLDNLRWFTAFPDLRWPTRSRPPNSFSDGSPLSWTIWHGPLGAVYHAPEQFEMVHLEQSTTLLDILRWSSRNNPPFGTGEDIATFWIHIIQKKTTSKSYLIFIEL